MATLQELAQIASDSLETRQRDNGDSFLVIQEDSPSWVQDICHQAHGDMFPDDHKYQFIADALDIIVEGIDEDEITERLDSDVDVYTHDLTAWLASSISRLSYVDDAVSEWGWESLDLALKLGQLAERREVYDAVYAALSDLADDSDDEDDDASDEAEETA